MRSMRCLPFASLCTTSSSMAGGTTPRRAARGRYLERVSTGNTHAPAVPEIGVNKDWQSHLGHAPYQTVETGRVIEMSVPADDRFDVAGIQLEPVHVADHTVRTHTCIEEQLVRVLPLRDRQQERQAVLGDQLVGYHASNHGGRRQSPARGRGRDPMRRALIGHEYVKNVIDERGDCERIDRLEWDLLASFCHSASLVRARFVGCESSGTSDEGCAPRTQVERCSRSEWRRLVH